MRIQDILGRVQETRHNDETLSYTGVRDFKDKDPEIVKMDPKSPNLKPRTTASKTNSYT